jgi:hypothetical protein
MQAINNTPTRRETSLAAMNQDGVYAWYALGVLTACYTLAFVDKQVISLLVGPTKAQFSLNDSAISALIGIAFTGSYVPMAFFFGRCADMRNRRNTQLLLFQGWMTFNISVMPIFKKIEGRAAITASPQSTRVFSNRD